MEGSIRLLVQQERTTESEGKDEQNGNEGDDVVYNGVQESDKEQEIKNGDRGDEDAQVLARKDKGGKNKG